MPTHTAQCVLVGLTPGEVRAWHDREGAFERLTPPWAGVRIRQRPRRLTVGEVAHFEVPLGPFPLHGEATITEVSEDGFIDEAALPLGGRWRHVHRMLAHPDGCALVDEVTWTVPNWAVHPARAYLSHHLRRLFAHRHSIIQADLKYWKARRSIPRQTIGISGATGSVGRALTAFLQTQGHEVRRFVRQPEAGGLMWRPSPQGVDPRDMEPLDAVVHLAGETIAQRWTSAAKQRIATSRVAGTHAMAEAIAASHRRPRLVAASAVGFYGHHPAPADETTPSGAGFLAEVGAAWEGAADAARAAGAVVVHPRIGLVLDASHGALAGMLPVFRLGLGGPMGAGDQAFPWVARDDLLDVLADAATEPEPPPILNVVAPEAVDQATFARTLGAVLGRPACIPAPSLLVRAAAGAMGEALLLEGARAVPAVLLRRDYAFRWPELRPALQHAVGHPPR